MSSSFVSSALAENGVCTVSLDDPDRRNALSAELLDELTAALESARDDDTVRCVVLASTHPTVFCAGGNLGSFGEDAAVIDKHLGNNRFPQLFGLLTSYPKPTICKTGGHTLAGGFGLALACDLIVASEKATFGTPEINVGVFPFMLMALLYRNISRKHVDQMMLLGERLTAGRGYEMGFVNRVVAPDELDGAVEEWAAKLAGSSPLLMSLGKSAIRTQRDMPLEQALQYLQGVLSLTLSTDDAREGLSAFFEKRVPVWTGH
jgi:enoyl-CoA hydratase/carnithine racemase